MTNRGILTGNFNREFYLRQTAAMSSYHRQTLRLPRETLPRTSRFAKFMSKPEESPTKLRTVTSFVRLRILSKGFDHGNNENFQ